MSDESGFRAYRVFCSMKAHFSSKNYNILDGLIHKQRLVNKWNEERFSTDGRLYFIVDEKFPKIKELIYMFAVYLKTTDNFHVSNVIDDNYETWEKFKWELKNFNSQLEIDKRKLKRYIEKEGISLKELITRPEIFSAKISLFTLIYLNMRYNITENMVAESAIEIKRLDKKKLTLNKLQLIFEKEINKRLGDLS